MGANEKAAATWHPGTGVVVVHRKSSDDDITQCCHQKPDTLPENDIITDKHQLVTCGRRLA